MKVKGKYILTIMTIIVVLLFPIETQAALQTNTSSKQNDYPLVLVHGLMGWGKGEALGYKYWGGLKDIENYLNQNGHKTYVATVGPVSSNWDRAVELYYYIKGGRVDYGAAHAKEHSHSRYGRTFPGIYSQWDKTNKIHLVGHSMGGQTTRTLVELLENGSKEEQMYYKEHRDEGISSLFEGKKSWVHSVTSLATPHNGSTFADQESLIPFIKELIIKLASTTGVSSESLVYDFKLEQWGLKRNPEESFTVYLDRVLKSKVWESDDISSYDLSTYGAQELNNWVKTHPDVYYFSHTGNASYKGLVTGHAYPILTMNPIMIGPSKLIGSYTRFNPEPIIDKSWFPNDGLVSVVSSKFPAGQPNKPMDGAVTVTKGEWNYLSTMEGWDHMDFIGILGSNTPGYWNIYGYYKDIAQKLHELPK